MILRKETNLYDDDAIANGIAAAVAAGITNYDSELTQTVVFNKLTNNGSIRGIYMQNGQMYVNMDYLQTGTLKAGGANNGNGIIEVYNGSGTRVGRWANDALYIGNISGVGTNGLTNPNTKIDSDGAITTKSLTANNYIYVDGNNSSFIRIPIPRYSSNANVEIGESGVSCKSPSNNIYTSLLGISIVDSSITYVPGIFCGNRSSLYASRLNGRYSLMSYDHLEVWNNTNTSVSIEPDMIQMTNRASVLVQFYTLSSGARLEITGNMSVTGTKSRHVDTSDYGKRLLYCYETPSPLFGDVGEGIIANDGKCYIMIDGIFAKTVTLSQYQVFLQKYGDGEAYVTARNSSYFIVEGTPGLAFGWEIKAKQSDFDQYRFEQDEFTELNIKNNIDYISELEQHIQNISDERGVA